MAKKANKGHCVLCGRPEDEVPFLLEGVDGKVCPDCVALAMNMLKENQLLKETKAQPFDSPELDLKALPKPQDIKEHLDHYVVGQDEAKRYLSVAVYNHYKRLLQHQEPDDEVEIEKSNILLLGPTGTGKTLLAKTIARLLQVPFTIVDATVLTQAGYVGEDIESLLTRLLQVADYDVAAAERGIVFIDEIDKIARKGDNRSIVNVPPQGGRKHPDQPMIQVNTQHILFICAGAFDGIERKIAHRLNTRIVGYNSPGAQHAHLKEEELLRYVDARDLKSYGLIPEIIGRLPIITHLNPLTRETLRMILTEPRNALTRQYTRMLAMDGIALHYTEDALDAIVEKTMEQKLGARGLRAIMEQVMMEAMYRLPSEQVTEFTIDRAYVEARLAESQGVIQA